MPRREGLERIYIEVPKDEGFKEKLKEIAKSHRRSLNQEVVQILEQAITAHYSKAKKKPVFK